MELKKWVFRRNVINFVKKHKSKKYKLTHVAHEKDGEKGFLIKLWYETN